MATVDVLIPRDVPTTLNYALPLPEGETPFRYVYAAPPGEKQTNEGNEPRDAVIHDLRGREDFASMDTTGFTFVKHTSEEKDFTDEEAIETKYYKEVEDILKKHAGAKRVQIFDHTIRRNYTDGPEGPGRRGPVSRVHVDQTFEAGLKRVYRHLGDDAERLAKGRVRIINVWRPIGHPVHHNPLALLDYRTVEVDNDLIPVRFIYPDRVGGVYSVRYNPNHQWYYLREQTPEEVTLIKCYDSEEDGRARLTPHSAFLDKSSPPDAPKRESIEVRCLVFDQE